MKPFRMAGIALLTGSLVLGTATPAFADGNPRGGRDFDRGYAGKNDRGYGRPGGDRRYNGHDRRGDRGDRRGGWDGHWDRGKRGRGDHYDRRYQPRVNPYRYSNYKRFPGPNYRPSYRYDPKVRVRYAPRVYSIPRYRNYSPRYGVGTRAYYPSRYVVNDYWRYGLYTPPRGHYWVNYDGDAYLTAIGTGLIAGVIIGAIAGGY